MRLHLVEYALTLLNVVTGLYQLVLEYCLHLTSSDVKAEGAKRVSQPIDIFDFDACILA